ncbi:ferredoxin [Mycobacterium sp. Y57]|uniref:ferredoxin n=1 Tax=Mycolicibacterium xanthum TaxID=2796469 RepID=UPI001C8417F6|nr:ferredoxin [Mycolicibacterium xanthum]MBX7433905.1 ferredoxin [Mycolicibacterium xanthum]
MKVRVDASRCQGHTLCAMIAPESFELDDVDGTAHAVSETVPAALEGQVLEAARSCPEQAIVLADEGSDTEGKTSTVAGVVK